jgi:large subunit ribosomal protein L2
LEGKGIVLKLINSAGYTAPVAMIKADNRIFFNVAANGIYENREIEIGENAKIESGNILPLKSIPIGTEVINIERVPFRGGKLIRTGGSSATVIKKLERKVALLLPSKKEILIDENSRATIGVVAAGGRVDKPIIKAGNRFYYMRSKSKHYPRTSPIKRNAVNHPFGGGRGKNMGKPSIAPRWAPPGRKVGLLRPRKTGRGR